MFWRRELITVPLQGGLGNQLFQLAAGLALRKRFEGVAVDFSDYWLAHPAAGETPRRLAIGGLLSPGELTSRRAGRTGGYTDRLFNHRVVERGRLDDSLARVGRFTRTVAGYFQRLEYVEEAWPALRHRLLASHDPRVAALANPAEGDHGAIHYRLGDYATNPSARAGLGVTGPDYFVAAMREGRQVHGVRHWLVVSDEPVRALQLLEGSGLAPGIEVSLAEASDEWDDLRTLASARICILSNSSFSWWGAYMGWRLQGTRVVAPTPWFADPSLAEPPLFPSAWERRRRAML